MAHFHNHSQHSSASIEAVLSLAHNLSIRHSFHAFVVFRLVNRSMTASPYPWPTFRMSTALIPIPTATFLLIQDLAIKTANRQPQPWLRFRITDYLAFRLTPPAPVTLTWTSSRRSDFAHLDLAKPPLPPTSFQSYSAILADLPGVVD